MSVTSTDWMSRAECRDEDPDLFIGPEAEAWHEKAAREAKALKVCARCPVTAACRAWNTTYRDEWSVAAAMTPEERKAA